ncbi:MAG TPA: TonB-dependent receptor, partial [Bryobacteraceae bacterium]|nr:TonB-dependent receptor [Bryobacteraceae bacterium]
MSKILRYVLALISIAALWSTGTIFAQTSNSSITGIVSDSSGAPIPGVSVVTVNTATGVNRTVTTNDAGAYTFSPLIPGTYEVRASNPGFKTQAVQNIVLETGAVAKVDIQLNVGEVTERIEVNATAPMLQTQEAAVAGVVTTSQLERIPVNGRNFTRLMVMMPGSSDISPAQSKGGEAGMRQISINGQRQQDNNFTIDGVDNNMMYMSSGVGAPPMDSIQEFRVATNNSAEYGRSAGANVNLSIKSGSRNLHGSIYEYLRNDKFDANDWFANAQSRGKVPFRQNQYGVALGGPVVLPKIYNGRESTFWFVSWEGYRFRRGNTAINTTAVAEQRLGDFSNSGTNIYDPLTTTINAQGQTVRQQFPNNIIPPNRINPGMKMLVDLLLPLPNRAGLVNNYVQSEGTRNDRDILVMRGDHSFSSTDNIWARYLRQRVGQTNPATFPTFTNAVRIDSDNFGLGWNHMFNPTTVLEARFGYNHPNNPGCASYRNGVTRADTLAKAGITIFDSEAWCDPVPAFAATGQFTLGGGGGETIIDTDYQYDAKISKMWGRHSFRVGGGFTRRMMDAFFANPTNGNADFWRETTASDLDRNSGNSFATLLLGYPSYIRRGSGVPNAQGRQNAFHIFVQDDWRMTDKLTMNFGLRWEGFNRPYDAEDKLGNLLITRDTTSGEYKAQLMWAGVNPLPDPVTGKVNEPPRTYGYGKSLMQSRMKNFAPRVGLAYQLNQKTVIRAGFGIFFNGTYMQELNDLRKFWPYLPQQELSPNRTLTPDLSISDPGPGFGSTQAIGGWPQDPNNRTPYSQQWNFFIQRELMEDLALDVGYVGSANRNQIGYVGWNNAPTPAPGDVAPRRLLASSGFTGNLDGGSNVFSSEYNSLQTKLTKRFSKGLSMLASYTWGKVMDDQSSLAEAKDQDMFNRRADWSRASFDIKHAFKVGYVYDLPFGKGRQFGSGWNRFTDTLLGGWALEGILQIQSGAPVNVRTNADFANVGKTQERP